MASNTQFIVEFKAELKEIKAAFAELDKLSKNFTKKKIDNISKEKKDRKEEKKHVEDISKKKLLTAKELYKQERLQFQQDKLRHQQASLYNKQLQQHAKLMASMGLGPGGQPLPKTKGGGIFTGAALGSFAGSFLGNAVSGLVNMVLSAVTAGYQRRVSLVESRSNLIGLAPHYYQIAGSIGNESGVNFGFNRQDVQNMVLPMARATGVTSPRELMAGMRGGGALSSDEMAQIFNTIRQGGNTFTPQLMGPTIGQVAPSSRGGEVFKKWIAAGTESGLEQARLPEFFGNIQNIMQEQLRVQSGQVTGNEIASLMGILQQSGVPGFQGARGGQVLSSLNQMFMSPGGGETGRAFLMQSQGFGLPGGTTRWYQAVKNLQSGITGEQGLKNLQNLLDHMKRMGFTGESGAVLLNTLSQGKISYDMAEKLQQVMGSGGDLRSKLQQMNKIMDQGKPLEEKAQDAMLGLEGDFKKFLYMFNESLTIGEKMEPLINEIQELLQKITKFIVGFLPYLKDIKEILPAMLLGPVGLAAWMKLHPMKNHEAEGEAAVQSIGMGYGAGYAVGGAAAALASNLNTDEKAPVINPYMADMPNKSTGAIQDTSSSLDRIAKAISKSQVTEGIVGALKMTVHVITQDGTQNVQSPGVVKITQ